MARKYDVAAVRALPVSPVPPGGLGGHGRRPAGDTGPPPTPLSRVPADGCDCPLRITPPPGHHTYFVKIERLPSGPAAPSSRWRGIGIGTNGNALITACTFILKAKDNHLLRQTLPGVERVSHGFYYVTPVVLGLVLGR